MANLQLPFSDGVPSQDTVFDVYCNGGGGTAVQGRSLGSDRGGYGGVGVVGTAEGGGVGVSGEAIGMDRDGDGGWAVSGQSESGVGVAAMSTRSWGVFSWSARDIGIYGRSDKPGGAAIEGGGPTLDGGTGVHGECDQWGGIGVHGQAYGLAGAGVYGEADNGYGVFAQANDVALMAWNPATGTSVRLAGYDGAGVFNGPVNINGPLMKNGGGFRIDHPLQPANKYLSHSFVESPDMKNIYDGTAVLNARGEATVTLPVWFEALNKDFRYQLTAIGSPCGGLYIGQEVKRNRFKIAGGKAGLKVSWQVTGIRKDPWANAHRIAVEERKVAKEKGRYRNPELYKKPIEMGVEWSHRPKQVQSPKALAEDRRQKRASLRPATVKANRILMKLKKARRDGRPTSRET